MAEARTKVASRKAGIATFQNDNAGSTEKKVIKANRVEIVPIDEFEKRFKFYENNRGEGTDEERARSIALSIAYGDTSWMLEPIKVDEQKKVILDGNTSGLARVIAHKEYGVDCEVIVVYVERPEGMSVARAVQILNNSSNQWKLDEYVKNQIAEGNRDYIRLKEMADELGGPFIKVRSDGVKKYEWSYVACLCGSEQKANLRDGSYTLDRESKKKQVEFGREIAEIWEKANKPAQGSWMEPFIVSLWKYKGFAGKQYDYDRLLKNVAKNRHLFDGSQSQKVWQERICSWQKQ